MYLLLRWILSALAILAVSSLVPGIHVTGFYTALIVALILGLLNAIVRPVLIILTLPINILTLGLFTFVINALLFWFVASFIKGFTVDGFWAAFFGSLIVTAVSWFVNQLLTSASRPPSNQYRAWWN